MPERCEHPGCYTHAVRLVIRGTSARLLCLKHTPRTRCNRCGTMFIAEGRTQHRCPACEISIHNLSREPEHDVLMPVRGHAFA